MGLTPLKAVLEKQYLKYIVYLVLSAFVASAITLGISHHFEKLQRCNAISNRISYLNDVFAREIIIGSPETLKFELNKLRADYDLKKVEFVKSSLNPDTCSPYSLNNSFQHPVRFAKNTLGYISSTQGPISLLKYDNLAFLIPLFVIIILSFSFIMSLKRILKSVFFVPITSMLDQADTVDLGKTNFSYTGDIKEFAFLKDKLNSMLERINQVNDKNNTLEKAASIGELAAQVAHDIRSPLEALKILKDDLRFLPESSRQRLLLSINRIEEVSYNLLKNHKLASTTEDCSRSEELLSLVESVVSEKVIESRKHPGIIFEVSRTQAAMGLFSKVRRGNLKCIISNLINNSCECFLTKQGKVEISLYSSQDLNFIEVKDNGPGIAPELHDKLFAKGFTTKDDGNGLGLFNARKDIEALGGTISFQTKEGQGSSFIISLPRAATPASFVSSINIYNYSRIVLLDDDPSFHEVWKDHFKEVTIPLEHFYSAASLLSMYSRLPSDVLLLSDFETMEEGLNGIDTILKLNHAANSILVTARSEEVALQGKCLKNGIKLLPKLMVRHTPIVSQRPLIVLIDDDRLVHLSWKSFMSNKNSDFFSFYTVDEFIQNQKQFGVEAKIFIDCNLGNDLRGEVESEKISKLGFEHLYLSTGYSRDMIEMPNWIKSVYSKNPDEIEVI